MSASPPFGQDTFIYKESLKNLSLRISMASFFTCFGCQKLLSGNNKMVFVSGQVLHYETLTLPKKIFLEKLIINKKMDLTVISTRIFFCAVSKEIAHEDEYLYYRSS